MSGMTESSDKRKTKEESELDLDSSLDKKPKSPPSKKVPEIDLELDISTDTKGTKTPKGTKISKNGEDGLAPKSAKKEKDW